MDVLTANGGKESKPWQHSRIDAENNITAYSPGEAIPDNGAERFTSERQLNELTAAWPPARLIEVWNSIPGFKPVKKFENRKKATSRIWKAVQSLVPAQNSADVAPKAASSKKRVTPKPKPHTGRDDSKKVMVIRLLERTKGATLADQQRVHRQSPNRQSLCDLWDADAAAEPPRWRVAWLFERGVERIRHLDLFTRQHYAAMPT